MFSVQGFCSNQGNDRAMIPLVGQAALAFQAQRGGRQRRLQARVQLLGNPGAAAAGAGAAAGGALNGVASQLVRTLVKEWSWGDHSAVAVQRFALRAYRDQEQLLRGLELSTGHIDPALRAVAALGGWGEHPANIHRELVRWLGDPDPPKPLVVEMPVKIGKPQRLPVAGIAQQGVLLPHEEFANLFSRNRPVFNQFILGNTEDSPNTPRRFWEGCEARHDPRLAGHAMRMRDGWRDHGVPLAIHGDAVPCVAVGKPGTKSLDTISWQSLLAVGSTLRPQTKNVLVFDMKLVVCLHQAF